MNIIQEDFVSFETAKLLKEKGFQQLQDNCGYFITEMIYSINIDDNGEHHFAHQYPAGIYCKDRYIAAPTLQMAMKWLREIYGLNIQVCIVKTIESKKAYNATIYNNDCEQLKAYFGRNIFDGFNSYEEAAEEAIKYCLINLI